MNTHIGARVAVIATLIAAAVCLMRLATPPPNLIDHCDYERDVVDSAPIVVVGVLMSDVLVSRPIPMRSDPKVPLQLRRLAVRVENVLRGLGLPEAITVYYFTWAGGFDGPRPSGFRRVGGRRILWLRRDSGVLRTACDGWDGCTEGIFSGVHPDYRPDPQRPVEYALVDLHLTRGKGTVNKIAFATKAFREEPSNISGLQEYAVTKLKHLALTEQDEIKSSACESLWIYTVDLVKPNIKQDAGTAMEAANCSCFKKPDGNVQCQ